MCYVVVVRGILLIVIASNPCTDGELQIKNTVEDLLTMARIWRCDVFVNFDI